MERVEQKDQGSKISGLHQWYTSMSAKLSNACSWCGSVRTYTGSKDALSPDFLAILDLY